MSEEAEKEPSLAEADAAPNPSGSDAGSAARDASKSESGAGSKPSDAEDEKGEDAVGEEEEEPGEGAEDPSEPLSPEEMERKLRAQGTQLERADYWRPFWLRGRNYADDEETAEAFTVSRADMMTYLNTQLWFNEAAWGIPFTMFLWAFFLTLLALHGDIESNYRVQHAVGGALTSVVGYAELGNTPAGAVNADTSFCPATCHCACVPRKSFSEPEACQVDALNRNYLNIKSVVDGAKFPEYTQEQLRSQMFTEKQNNMQYQEPMPYDDVNDITTFWFWLQHGLLPALWQENDFERLDSLATSLNIETSSTTTTTTTTTPSVGGATEGNVTSTVPPITTRAPAALVAPIAVSEKPGRLYSTNQLIGGVRLRQYRVEETNDCDVSSDLQSFYDARCRTSDPDTTSRLRGIAHPCFTMHSEDEGIYDCPFDIDTQLATKNGPLETVEFMLQPNDWIDGASEYIELQAAFFNAEVRLYSFAKLRFTFEKGGFMHKTVKVNALSENLYPSFWYIVPDLIFLGMVSTLAYQEGGEVIHCRNTGLLKYYLSDFWNLIDWVSILAGFGISFLWFQMVIATGLLGDQLAEMVPAPAVITQSYRAKWGKILDELDTLGTTQEVQFMLLYWYTLVLMLRFFKNFQGQPRLSQISSTLMKSLGDMVHFIIVFAVVLINFAIGGNLMFGTSSENWATIMDSVNTSMMALLGNIDMDQLMQISPITAYLWFWSFMVVNFFVLLNLLVAIVFDHYYNFRDTVGETQGLGSQIWDVMGEKSWSMDWYLQRKQYLKKGIIPKPDYLVFEFTIRGRTFGIDPARFGYLWLDEQMGYEDVYEALMEESPEGPQYGRPTLLEQMQKKRNADRQAFEESLRKDGKIFSRSPAKEAEGVAGSCPGTEGAHASPFDLEMSDTDFESHADGRGTTTYGGSKGSSYVPPRERVGQNMAKHETDRRKIIGAGRRRTNSKPMRGLFAIREEGTLRSTSKNKNIEKLRSAMTANNMHMLRNSMNIANEQMNRGVGGYDSEQITGIHPNHGVFGEGHHRMADDDDEDSKPILVGDGESSGGKESSAAGRDAAEKKEEGSESPGGGLDHSGSGAGTSEGEGSNKDDAADASGDPDVRKKKTMSAFQRHEEQLAYLREQIGVAELEELGVEPRFARHLMLRCKKFVLDETGYEEKRKQELTSLARNAADLLNDIQHETVALVKQVNLVLEGVCKSCADLSMDVDGTHMKLANLQRQRGVMACRGTAVAALPYSEQLWNQGKMTKTVPGLQEEEDNRRNAALELLGGVGAKKAFKALLPVAAASSAKG